MEEERATKASTQARKVLPMSTSNYAKGRSAEYACIGELQDTGFTCMRSAGSKGDIDVAGWNDVELRLIQIKRSKRKQTMKKQREAMAQMVVPPNATLEFWIWLVGEGWYKKFVVREGTLGT